MIHHRYRASYIFPAFAALLAAVLLTVPDRVARSERLAPLLPPNSSQLPMPANDPANIEAGPLSGGGFEWTTDFSSSERANAVALQSDGKIVAAGRTAVVGGDTNIPDGGSSYFGYDFAVFRYNVDGSLDTSFDADGKVTASFSSDFGDDEVANAVAIQTDGKIIAAGHSQVSEGSFAIVRFHTDGSPDNSFGSGGKVITEMESGGILEIAVQADGKIVAVGSDFTIVRYNPNGSLDSSFGTGGIVTTSFAYGLQSAFSIALQADGKIVAAGEAATFCDDKGNCSFDFALARYNTDGSLDTSFDADGRVTTAFGEGAVAHAVVVQPDGKIVAAGNVGTAIGVARYIADGSLDASFDGDGKVTMPTANTAVADSVAVQANGRIVISARTDSGNVADDFSLFRLNTDGSLDPSFDGDGRVTTQFGSSDAATDVAVQSDGKIVAAGYSGTAFSGGGAFDFALSRYNADGSLDTAFHGDGKLTTSYLDISSAVNATIGDLGSPSFLVGYANNGVNDDFAVCRDGNGEGFVAKMITPIGNSDDRANAAARDTSNRIIAAGYSNNGSTSDFALVRYSLHATVDTSFGVNGKVTTDFGGNDEATAVAVQADNKILVVGKTSVTGSAALILARYNDNGSLDTSFGTGGRVIVEAIQNPKAMAVQLDGKIIAAGSAPHTVAPFGDNFALARFNADGTLDTSFDGDGIGVVRFDFSSQVNSLVIQPYGKIIAAGFTLNETDTVSQFALARLQVDGSLDTSFDADGKVTTSFGAKSRASGVRLQGNGKIVAVGVALQGVTGRDFALARYNQNGSLDATWTNDFFGSDDEAFAAGMSSGMIVAAGSARRGARFDFATARYSGEMPRSANHDYDGDGWADLSVFRPSNGTWYFNRSTQGYTATEFGLSTDTLAPGDYNGDGKTDMAIFRDGAWWWRYSGYASATIVVQFGSAGDVAVPANYLLFGESATELAVYRGGTWWMRNLANGQISVVQFGLPTDKPVPADYDGDGRADQAVYRNGEWHINGSTRGYTVTRFGLPNDKPVPADYDGDGKTDLAVYRDGIWYLLKSTNGFAAFQWGLSSDIPVPADYDGDGKTDAAVFRDGTWYLLQTSGGVSIHQFGLPGDKPVAAAFLP